MKDIIVNVGLIILGVALFAVITVGFKNRADRFATGAGTQLENMTETVEEWKMEGEGATGAGTK